MVFWIPIWITGWVMAYIYWPLAKTMLWILLWQFCAIVGIAILCFVGYWLIVCIANCIQKRRDRKYYQQQYLADPYQSDLAYYPELQEVLLRSQLEQPSFEGNPENNMNAIADVLRAPSELDGIKSLFEEEEDHGFEEDSARNAESIDMIEDNINRAWEQVHNARRQTLGEISINPTLENLRMRKSF